MQVCLTRNKSGLHNSMKNPPSTRLVTMLFPNNHPNHHPMKSPKSQTLASRAAILLLAAIGFLALGNRASAAFLYWNPGWTSGPLVSGSGNWDSTTSNWSASTSPTSVTTWVPSDEAYFQAAGTETVTIPSSVTTTQLITTGTYVNLTISGGTLNLVSGNSATTGSIRNDAGGDSTSTCLLYTSPSPRD